MSYDIELRDPKTGQCIELAEKHNIGGGTQELGGTRRLWLNVTYNYATHFIRALDSGIGIRVLYGKTGAECIPILESGIAELKADVHANYWKATEGNARQALVGLLAFAKMRPDGVFAGD